MVDMPQVADGRQRELRLALSMNGGVSLAVWIGGAVSEIDCMRRGEGFWGDLLESCGFSREALVDVLTGASAGGLNAVLMAQAIRSKTPFSEFLSLWQQNADIDKLIKPPLHATDEDPRAILRGRFFLDALRKALDKPADPNAVQPHLAVFASATLVLPDPVEFKDVPGAPIAETRSDAYFHIARRGSVERGLDGFEPSELVIGNVEALALVGRATSSLPGLFEPVAFEHATFGSRLVGAFAESVAHVEVMDGGVIDNVPISRAIRAIANSPADGRVRRVLLYLHPDPGGRHVAATGDPATGLQVVRLFLGKRRESIREDIELLRSHNDAVERRRDEGEALLQRVLHGPNPVEKDPAGQRSALQVSVDAAMLLRAAIDPPSELAWHAPNVPRVVPLVDGPNDPSKAELAADITDTVQRADTLLAVAPRRTALGLQRLVSSVAAEAIVDVSVVQPRVYELLLLCDVITSYQLARFLGHGDGSAPTTRLTMSRVELDAIRVGDELDDATWNALASWDLSEAATITGGRSLVDYMASRVAMIVDEMPAPPDGLESTAAEVVRRLKAGRLRAADIDRVLLPLAAEPVASDQPIEFVRVAGDVETPASVEFAKHSGRDQPKIAGLQLHHLGAFFGRNWRTNDWTWGQLDSVKALLDVVLDEEAEEELRHSGYLAENGFTGSAQSTDDIKKWLLRTRQMQILNAHLTPQPTFEQATNSQEFVAWARTDRRLSSLLGTKTLTSTAIRGVITASKVLRHRMSVTAKIALTLVRPALLAIAGVVLAGRRAAAAIAWTLCGLAAVRLRSPTEAWAVWGIGVALAAGIAGLVEVKIRPAARNVWALRPYGYAIAAAVFGVVGIVNRGSLAPSSADATIDWRWALIPPIAAGISAAMLFFWMRWWADALLTAFTASLYFLFGYAADRAEIGRPLANWPKAWGFHSLWVCWLLAVLGIPILIGFMPENMLRPRRRWANEGEM
jgi:hypothetical protein